MVLCGGAANAPDNNWYKYNHVCVEREIRGSVDERTLSKIMGEREIK